MNPSTKPVILRILRDPCMPEEWQHAYQSVVGTVSPRRIMKGGKHAGTMMNTHEEEQSAQKVSEPDQQFLENRKSNDGVRGESCIGTTQASGLGAVFNIYYDVCSCMGCMQTCIG